MRFINWWISSILDNFGTFNELVFIDGFTYFISSIGLPLEIEKMSKLDQYSLIEQSHSLIEQSQKPASVVGCIHLNSACKPV